MTIYVYIYIMTSPYLRIYIRMIIISIYIRIIRMIIIIIDHDHITYIMHHIDIDMIRDYEYLIVNACGLLD